jgi:peptidoglycan/LPS O-acetylase OafA/YrhL
VVAVVLYHSNLGLVPRGFLGVDVFFVISGYLITGIIFHDLHHGSFSISNFYERRARRILPALLFITAATIPLAWIWLMPTDLKDFSQSLVAIVMFSSNVLFLKESGYFEISSELKPLLHTWSLSVEEQFYLFFPFLLLGTFRNARRLLPWVILIICIIGFAFAALIGESSQLFVFYMLLGRAWELLFGAVCFLLRQRIQDSLKYELLRKLLSYFGIFLIASSFLGKVVSVTYPWVAVPSVLGAGLILVSLPVGTFAFKFLSSSPLIFIGLISYSIYLWHQPLFALAKQRALGELSLFQTIFLLVLTGTLGALTWRFIETPFRDKRKINRKALFRFVGFFSSMLLIFGLFGQFTSGNVSRFGERWKMVDEQIYLPNYGLREECEADFKFQGLCRTGSDPEIMVWGDSFAMQIIDGILASNSNAKILQYTNSNCAPVIGLAVLTPGSSYEFGQKCIKSNRRVLKYLKVNSSIEYVVFSGEFRNFFNKESFIVDSKMRIVRDESAVLRGMEDTLRAIRSTGKIPVIFSPTPQNGIDLGRCTKKAKFFEEQLSKCNFNFVEAKIFQQKEILLLESLEGLVSVIRLEDGICNQKTVCQVSKNGIILYRDSGHLTKVGSAFLGKKMDFYSLIRKSQ